MELLVVGLGNFGKKYEYTRHNIGWDIFEELSFSNDLRWTNKFKGQIATVTVEQNKIHFLKPETYMNLSGESVVPCMQFYKIPIENIIVCHDELDLPFGTIGYKNGGGLAGHNGLKSIAGLLGSQDFKRLRIGIGRPQHGDVSNWVLSGYTGEDAEFFRGYLKETAKTLEYFFKNGFQKTQTQYSKKKVI
jgi:PTH1 family peptidyl-tRNA hydrolase